MQLPQPFCDRMQAMLGAEAPRFFEAQDKEPCRSFRFDPEKVSRQELFAALGDLHPVPFGENALYFSFDGIGAHPLHQGGALYVQEPAAMAPVASLPKRKFSRILDLCAAPGGKSLQAAATRLEEDGLIVCNEPDARRRAVLIQNLERMGEKRATVTGFDATRLPEEFRASFDLVICDAPCSGEGMMRKNPDAAALWSERHVEELAALQERILQSAVAALAAGGVLLYSTCTWSVEENEAQVLRLLRAEPALSLTEPSEAVAQCAARGIPLEGEEALRRTLRFYPHLFSGEGQFVAVLQRAGEPVLSDPAPTEKKKKERPHPDEGVVRAFLEDTLDEKTERPLLLRGDTWYLAGTSPFPAALFCLPGIPVGQVQKGRIIPHHSLFKCLGRSLKQKVILSPAEAEKYLHGEEVPVPFERGFATVYLGSCPLGGVRCSGGRGKNLYPKGLRT